jgi:predicted regulator of amino acid metabolism with ACT domain
MDLRQKIDEYLKGLYVQQKIAHLLLKNGLKIKDDKIFCGSIEQSNSKIARALSVDYRAVTDTINRINKEPELQKLFSTIEPTSDLRNTAQILGWGVVEIIQEDPRIPHVLAGVSQIIADNNIVVKQMVVEDYELAEDPKVIIVTETPIPFELLSKMKIIKGVKGIIIY